MDQELAQSRITKHTIDQVIGSVSEADYPMNPGVTGLPVLPESESNNFRPQIQRDSSWAAQEDSRSDTSDALSANDFNRARAIWGNEGRPAFSGQSPAPPFQSSEALASTQWMSRNFSQHFDAPLQFSNPSLNNFGGDRNMSEPDLLMAPPAGRRSTPGSRFGRGAFPYASSGSSYDGYTPISTPYGSVGGMSGGAAPMGGQMGINGSMNSGASLYGGYQPQPIGTPLSPMAPEFSANNPGYVSSIL